MSEPTLLDFYLDVLDTAGLQVDDDFFVVHKADSTKKKPENVIVMKKKLVLPFPAHLKNPDPDNNVFFHPLCEQIIRGESEVFTFLKRAMTMRLILSVSTLGSGLIHLHTNINLQKSMSIKQIEFIKGLVDVEDKTTSLWNTFIWGHIKEHPHDSTHWPLRMYIKQNGRYANKSYQRVCSVAFPLFEKLIAGEEMNKPGSDQKFRAKDYKAFKQIALAIFPEAEQDVCEVFNSGYGDTFAPNLLAFLMSFKKIGDRINTIAETLREPLEKSGIDLTSIMVPMEWSSFIEPEGIAKLSTFNRKIPALPGNMGVATGRQDVEVQEETAPEKPSARVAPVNDAKARLRERWEAESSKDSSPPWEEEKKDVATEGKRTIGDILRKRPELERSTRTYEEEMDTRGRGGWRDRGRYEEDDRYPRRGGYRDDRRGYRDEPRGGYRDDPRGYRDEPRGYRDEPRGYRDEPRGYRGDSRGSRPAPRRSLFDDAPVRGGWRR